ncbi:AMP-dependent synthetase/ligase [Dillenia turbinata]|uniref:AMP-dependent synthetase/ligase n=1 Tax=Dillenia turbinata TaxID=194707 RepID=A0AAN8ZEJ8_9MAGN
MAEELNPKPHSSIDVESGFCTKTKIYHSLLPDVPLPPESMPLSVTDYAFALLKGLPSSQSSTALIDADTGDRVSFSELIRRSRNLAAYLQNEIGLINGETAFILSPNSVHIVILYLSLFSLGVVISPSNPSNTKSEIAHHINLCKPVVAFATTKTTSFKIPPLRHSNILLDSSDFQTMMTETVSELKPADVSQSDIASILYSSGTTGKMKGVIRTHRNWIASIAIARSVPSQAAAETAACVVPLFHGYGFEFCMTSMAFGRTLVLMERFELELKARAIERFRSTQLLLAPPVVVSMVKNGVMDGHDLRSLKTVACGGAVLPKSAIKKFRANEY